MNPRSPRALRVLRLKLLLWLVVHLACVVLLVRLWWPAALASAYVSWLALVWLVWRRAEDEARPWWARRRLTNRPWVREYLCTPVAAREEVEGWSPPAEPTTRIYEYRRPGRD